MYYLRQLSRNIINLSGQFLVKNNLQLCTYLAQLKIFHYFAIRKCTIETRFFNCCNSAVLILANF